MKQLLFFKKKTCTDMVLPQYLVKYVHMGMCTSTCGLVNLTLWETKCPHKDMMHFFLFFCFYLMGECFVPMRKTAY